MTDFKIHMLRGSSSNLWIGRICFFLLATVQQQNFIETMCPLNEIKHIANPKENYIDCHNHMY